MLNGILTIHNVVLSESKQYICTCAKIVYPRPKQTTNRKRKTKGGIKFVRCAYFEIVSMSLQIGYGVVHSSGDVPCHYKCKHEITDCMLTLITVCLG